MKFFLVMYGDQAWASSSIRAWRYGPLFDEVIHARLAGAHEPGGRFVQCVNGPPDGVVGPGPSDDAGLGFHGGRDHPAAVRSTPGIPCQVLRVESFGIDNGLGHLAEGDGPVYRAKFDLSGTFCHPGAFDQDLVGVALDPIQRPTRFCRNGLWGCARANPQLNLSRTQRFQVTLPSAQGVPWFAS